MPHRAWIRNSSSGLSLLWGTLGAKATSLKSPSNLGSPAPSVSVANVGRDERPDTRQSPCPVGSLKHKVRQDDLRSTVADPGVLFVTGVFLPTATSGRGGSGSLGPAVPGLELDQLGQRERERRLRPGFAAAAWAGPSSLRLVPWHGSRPGGRRLGGRRVLGDPPSQARGASARPASGLCSDLGTSVLRAERLQPSALSGGDALCADWGGIRRTPWRPRSGDCGVLGLSGHLGSNQWPGPSLLRPSALSHSPPTHPH